MSASTVQYCMYMCYIFLSLSYWSTVHCTVYNVQYSVHGNASFCCILNTHASSFHMLSCWALSIFCTKFFSISVSDVYVHDTVLYVLISLLFYNFSIRCLCTWYSMYWFHYFFTISVSDVYLHGTVCIDFITFLQFQYPMSMYSNALISLLYFLH